MSDREDQLAVLARGLDQAEELLRSLDAVDPSVTTPCADWTMADLVDHVVAAPGRFAQMVRGEKVDWSAPTPHVEDDPAAAFRVGADDLLGAWSAAGEAPMGPDWQSAEIAVHTYDLAAGVGRSTADFDAEVAERGLAFMQAQLTPEARGDVFGPEQPAPDDADAYQRIAAFAGRDVTASR